MINDTICAAATPPVNSALALIRISGLDSISVAKKIFTNHKAMSHKKAVYGSIVDNTKTIDDVILTQFSEPNSFTGEDSVEIACHGNHLVVHKILTLLGKHDIRIAEPGEFSRRAFLNGKIDLTEAEAINHLITAKSNWEIDTAIKQMHGSLKSSINEIKEQLILLKADIESSIDFIEEDIEFISKDDAIALANKLQISLKDLFTRCKIGEKMAKGINVTIAGKPNVGKSSLLNMILNQERAIVSDIPGTTRDLIRESVQIAGVHINIIDTAGIDKPSDEIEKIGIELSHKEIESASIVLMVIDSFRGIDDVDRKILEKVKDKNVIFLLNKSDISSQENIKKINQELNTETIPFSTKSGDGFSKLEERISSFLNSNFADINDSFVADLRIINLLEKASENIISVISLLKSEEPAEITSFEIQSMIDNLGEITGEISPDTILDSIFSRFCIGK